MNITHNGTTIEVPEERQAALEAEFFAEKEWPFWNGDKFFYKDEDGSVYENTWPGGTFDRHFKAIGNCFRTREGAEAYDGYDILKALQTIREHARKNGLQIATKEQMRDVEVEKYSVNYAPEEGLFSSHWIEIQDNGYPSFLARPDAYRSITDCRDAWLTLFGGE